MKSFNKYIYEATSSSSYKYNLSNIVSDFNKLTSGFIGVPQNDISSYISSMCKVNKNTKFASATVTTNSNITKQEITNLNDFSNLDVVSDVTSGYITAFTFQNVISISSASSTTSITTNNLTIYCNNGTTNKYANWIASTANISSAVGSILSSVSSSLSTYLNSNVGSSATFVKALSIPYIFVNGTTNTSISNTSLSDKEKQNDISSAKAFTGAFFNSIDTTPKVRIYNDSNANILDIFEPKFEKSGKPNTDIFYTYKDEEGKLKFAVNGKETNKFDIYDYSNDNPNDRTGTKIGVLNFMPDVKVGNNITPNDLYTFTSSPGGCSKEQQQEVDTIMNNFTTKINSNQFKNQIKLIKQKG